MNLGGKILDTCSIYAEIRNKTMDVKWWWLDSGQPGISRLVEALGMGWWWWWWWSSKGSGCSRREEDWGWVSRCYK